jgi:hypothetical protein
LLDHDEVAARIRRHGRRRLIASGVGVHPELAAGRARGKELPSWPKLCQATRKLPFASEATAGADWEFVACTITLELAALRQAGGGVALAEPTLAAAVLALALATASAITLG